MSENTDSIEKRNELNEKISSEISYFTKLIETEPDNKNYYLERGQLYLVSSLIYRFEDTKEKDYRKKAYEDFDRYIDSNPNDVSSYMEIISSSIFKKCEHIRYEYAIKCCTNLIELEPNNAEYHFLMSCYPNYNNEDHYVNAITHCEKAIKLAPTNPDYYAKLAEIYVKTYKDRYYYNTKLYDTDMFGSFNKALENYSRAIKIDPENADYRAKRASVYKDKYISEDTIIEHILKNSIIENNFEDNKDVQPISDSHVWMLNFERERRHEKMESYDNALKDYKKAIELDPDNAYSYSGQCTVYFVLGQYENALKVINKAIELRPDEGDYYGMRGNIYRKMNNDDIALENYNKAIELNPDNIQNYIYRGILFYIRNQYEDAINDFTECYDRDQENCYNAHRFRKECYLKLGRYEDAKDDAMLEVHCRQQINDPKSTEFDIESRRFSEKVEVIKYKKQISQIKTNIFQAVSHTISNIMLANKGIIHKIKNQTSSATDIDRLELLNNLVLSTMKAIKLAFSKDSVAFAKTENDLFFQKTGNSISLYHFLYFCLNVNLYYLVTGEEGWETIREIFFDIDEDDEDDLESKLSALETMRKTPGFAISELSENNVNKFVNAFRTEVFYPVSRFFDIQTDDLKDIYVKNSSYTFSILFIIFLELSKNMLRYGTVEDESVRKFAIRTESSLDGCRIIMSNICKKSRLTLKESTLQGLAMIQEFSKALGDFEKWENDIPDTDFTEFTTVLFINRQN
ncbi:MAG: tetratricopeptide repeat protein [Desulfococcaceae bacterium]|jgi:tetratricopeptide (TPR) repeat protein|nr:tetratricopeptide repeat protein [Desulfococcaceae bacterium]